MSIHHGRGSEAKGMHFYQTIQLRQLQDQQLVTILTHSLTHSLTFFFSFHFFFALLLPILVKFILS
jgi:hypothetical protein